MRSQDLVCNTILNISMYWERDQIYRPDSATIEVAVHVCLCNKNIYSYMVFFCTIIRYLMNSLENHGINFLTIIRIG